MIITNKLNLPQSFVQMASRDYTFEANEYRVTSLLKGIRETILERRYKDEIENDVSEMIWLLFGTAVHNILEHQTEKDCELKEQRIKIEIGDYVLSGQFDLYNAETKKITDYKTASIWKVIYNDYDDWRKQLLIYSWMMRQIGFEVDNAEIVAVLKDHKKSEAKRKPDYPQFPVKVISFKFTEQDFLDIEYWLLQRFALILDCERRTDGDLPHCSQEERWNDGDKFAVMKGSNKRALRVLDTQEEAEEWLRANGGTHIETRPGEDKKCNEYCDANLFCNYYNQELKKGVG